ncbi:MAG: hypothetical protein BWY66_01675 [bacterium ADurb.Bin374]|nr:MAG: hypothetical protein BWY66_01675 [bacterium ADurb.Bin374]
MSVDWIVGEENAWLSSTSSWRVTSSSVSVWFLQFLGTKPGSMEPLKVNLIFPSFDAPWFGSVLPSQSVVAVAIGFVRSIAIA